MKLRDTRVPRCISNSKQAYNEDVLSYSRRVENCLIKLINSLDNNLTPVDRRACVKLLQKQALGVFIMGLRKDISILVKSQRPESLEGAIHIAPAEETEQKSQVEIARFQNLSLRGTKQIVQIVIVLVIQYRNVVTVNLLL